MSKFLKKEKINYLKGARAILDNTISYENLNNNNITTTLTNISNQLKNIAIGDKNKEIKMLNSSFRAKNKNQRNIRESNTKNNLVNSSFNIDNNQNPNKSNFFDITSNSEFNQKFQGLQKIKVFNFYILRQFNNDNDKTYYEEIKKENLELKENVKFLLKQIKKYQKCGLTIEDMNITRQQELENLEKEIIELKEDINKYKNKILLLDNNNKNLINENSFLKNYINDNLNKIKVNPQKELRNKINNNIYRKKDFNKIQKEKEKEFEPFYDIGAFDEKNVEYNNLNVYYNKKKRNFIENDIINNSKLSEVLLADIGNEENNKLNKSNFLYIKEYSNHANKFRKPRTNLSEGKLYCRKNIGKSYLSFNDVPYSTKKSNNNNFTYSKSYLKNNYSNKK